MFHCKANDSENQSWKRPWRLFKPHLILQMEAAEIQQCAWVHKSASAGLLTNRWELSKAWQVKISSKDGGEGQGDREFSNKCLIQQPNLQGVLVFMASIFLNLTLNQS